MNYNNYLVKKGKTDLVSSLRAMNKKIINEELEYRNLKNIGELKKDIIKGLEFCLESSKDDLCTIIYFKRILENENTNQMVIFDDDIESLWAFVYKSNGEYSYYIADEIKEIIKEKIEPEILKQDSKIKKTKEDLENYINNISNKYLDELYKKVENKDKNLSKQRNVILAINDKFITSFFTIENEEAEQIKQIVEGKIPNEISDAIKNNYVFFDKYGDKKYFVPEYIKEIVTQTDFEEQMNGRKETVVSFYIEANGIIKLDKLIELTKATGINVTKKEVKEIAKALEHYISGDIIYLNKELYDLKLDKELLKRKNETEYKIFTFLEIILLLPIILANDYFIKIYKIIYKKTKDKPLSISTTNIILIYTRMLIDYESEVSKVLTEKKISLTLNEDEKLFNILAEASSMYPKWILNGETVDIFDKELFDDDDDDESFDALSNEEKIDIYIWQYVSINGVITLEKMLEILKCHNINTTKKEVIKIVKKSDDLNVCKEYICFKGLESEIDNILMNKLTNEFKMIDDPNEFLDELEFNSQRVLNVCSKYGISDETGEEILSFMSFDFFEKELLNIFLMGKNIVLPKSLLDNLYKEFAEISKDIRNWKYNGYTENEIKLLSKKSKK